MRYRICVPLVLAALLAGGLWQALPSAPAAKSKPASAEMPSDLVWQGVGSCAASACHNDGGKPGTKRSEYTTWANLDKHANAYTVLFDERSRIIEKNYRKLQYAADAHAEEDQTCLACHSMNAPVALQGPQYSEADGVGCERCHGPAQKWLMKHYQVDWKQMSSQEKLALGFLPTKDLLVRGKQCVTCHVGTPEAEVDHDLIAAGHPRLNFEYGAYLANMPKHWNEREEKARQPDLEARVWALGQVLSAQSAMQLLEHRARSDTKPWPELAEYDCFACHHDLQAASWRQKRGYGQRLPGSLDWSDWYPALLPQALTLQGVEPVSFEEIRKEMNKPSPDRQKVANLAQAAAKELSQRLGSFDQGSYDPASLRRRFAAIAAGDPKSVGKDWDSAAQCYLALAALYNGLTDLQPKERNPETKASLLKMAEQLRFPAGRKTTYDSPGATDPATFGDELQKLHKQLGGKP